MKPLKNRLIIYVLGGAIVFGSVLQHFAAASTSKKEEKAPYTFARTFVEKQLKEGGIRLDQIDSPPAYAFQPEDTNAVVKLADGETFPGQPRRHYLMVSGKVQIKHESLVVRFLELLGIPPERTPVVEPWYAYLRHEDNGTWKVLDGSVGGKRFALPKAGTNIGGSKPNVASGQRFLFL